MFDCPKLLSMKLEQQMEAICEVFDLYHKIKQEQVIEIFRAFPYLFCCDPDKMRLFMAHFRKYKFSQRQIIDLVSYPVPLWFSLKIRVGFWSLRFQTSPVSSIT